jgi:Mg2+-importing ATPase
VSGEATALVVRTGKDTELGKISARMGRMDEPSAFQIGIRHFGYLLMRMTFLLSAGILIFNLFFHKPMVESILFSIALASGWPRIAAAILVTTLSAGAMRMAKDKVIVKRWRPSRTLVINILCSDKTGTLTVGSASTRDGGCHQPAQRQVRLYAYLNAVLKQGSPIRWMRRSARFPAWTPPAMSGGRCLRFLAKATQHRGGERRKATPDAHQRRLTNVLDVCSHAEMPDGTLTPIATANRPSEGMRGPERAGIAHDRVGLEGRERRPGDRQGRRVRDDLPRVHLPGRPAQTGDA